MVRPRRAGGRENPTPTSLLEVAAGGGVVTRAMATGLPDSVLITATDLSQSMLDHAEAVGTARPVTWQQADVMDLPFATATFDAVVCQFGAMFFPDRTAAYAEVRRVLRPGGVFLFNVWDSLDTNEFPREVEQKLATMFPEDPPTFMSRAPHGYFDEATIRSEVAAAGFNAPIKFEAVEARSRAATADIVAMALCLGTPLRSEIEARDPSRLDEAVAAATEALAARFGPTDLDGRIRGFVIAATAP
jgi:SAM-dependent methyltransferase